MSEKQVFVRYENDPETKAKILGMGLPYSDYARYGTIPTMPTLPKSRFRGIRKRERERRFRLNKKDAVDYLKWRAVNGLAKTRQPILIRGQR